MHALEGEGEARRVRGREAGGARRWSGDPSRTEAGGGARVPGRVAVEGRRAARGAEEDVPALERCAGAAAVVGSTAMPQTGSRAERVLSIMADAVSCEPRVYPLRARRMSQPTRYRATIAYVGTRLPRLAGPEERAAHGPGGARGRRSRTWRARPCASRAPAAPTPACTPTARSCTSTCRGGAIRARSATRSTDSLPEDVRVLAVEEAAPDFHARLDAVWKEYLYRWSRAEVIAPRDAPFVAPISPRARRRAPARGRRASLPGTRDFRVFAVTPPAGESTVRNAPLDHRRRGRAPSSRRSFAATGSCAAWCARSAACWPTWPRGRVPRGPDGPRCSRRATGGCFPPRRRRTG